MLRNVTIVLGAIGFGFLFKAVLDPVVDALMPAPEPAVRVTDAAARSRAVNRCKSQIEGELYHPETVVWEHPEFWTVWQDDREIRVHATYQARSDMAGMGVGFSTCHLEHLASR